MLTQCPNCQTIYQISAGELGAAKGFVECGECGVQFNALDRIADEPQFDSESTVVTKPASEAVKPAPTFVLMEDSDSALSDEAHAAADAEPQLPATDVPTEQSEIDSKENISNRFPESSDGQDHLAGAALFNETEEHDKTVELEVLTNEPTAEKFGC